MIPVSGFEGRKIAVFGLGGSGIATAHALAAGGAEPLAWDDFETSRSAAAATGIVLADPAMLDWSDIAALVLSPGVPLNYPEPHPVVLLAEAAKVPVIGDVELFARERLRIAPTAPLVAVTGTNGKSTTVALIAHLLSEAGEQVELGGNFGPAVLSLRPPSPSRVHVLECSSYQIELAPSLTPSVGVLLNISPDHIDRHGTFERYAEIKSRLARGSERVIIGVDDIRSARIADHIEQAGGRVTRISVRNPLADGYFLRGSEIVRSAAGAEEAIASLTGINSLRGQHNAQNAIAAVAALEQLGIALARIVAGLRTFPGLAHRMEEVRRIGRAVFINDSKATNADATARALASFNHIYWIVGGRPKADGIAGLEPFFPRVAKAFLIGEAAEEFARTMEGKVAFELSATLENAVEAAAALAARDPAEESAILLSPAAASFDQFRNFAERGDVFRRLALDLAVPAGQR